jgi:c-di-GMP-binding flagellar brake protein YcgR
LVTFFFFAIIFILIALYFTRTSKGSSGSWLKFYSKGKEGGFTIRDLEQLKRLVANSNIYDPVSIFTSKKQFETVIRGMISSARTSGEINDLPVQDLLSKMFDYLKKIEMEAKENEVRISNSRQIGEGQSLRVLVSGTGVFNSEVVRNLENYLTISRPVNAKMTSTMQWHDLKVSIYFWREDDAGYVFDTEVIDEVFSKGISSLKVEHKDSLFRTQKRKSMRAKLHKTAFLYMVRDAENPHLMETSAGLICMLEDISDTGCAFKINGRATSGLRLKVQFSLGRIPICMPGTTRSFEYDANTNTSLVHMEADTLPMGVRNHILCEVFDLLPEDNEELPFRVPEEEADAASSRNGDSGTVNKLQDVVNA